MDVRSGWFAQTGEIRRHVQMLIVEECIADLTKRARDGNNEYINVRLARGVSTQVIFDENLSKQSNCFVSYGIVDFSWPSMRIALSVHSTAHSDNRFQKVPTLPPNSPFQIVGEVILLSLFRIEFHGQGFRERRVLQEFASLPNMAWKGENSADLGPLLHRVPLSSVQAGENVQWSYLGREFRD